MKRSGAAQIEARNVLYRRIIILSRGGWSVGEVAEVSQQHSGYYRVHLLSSAVMKSRAAMILAAPRGAR